MRRHRSRLAGTALLIAAASFAACDGDPTEPVDDPAITVSPTEVEIAVGRWLPSRRT